jgi:hypothetical protein
MLAIKPELSVSEIEQKLFAELSALPIEGMANYQVCKAHRELVGANWDIEVHAAVLPRGFAAALACVVPDLQKQYDVDWLSP